VHLTSGAEQAENMPDSKPKVYPKASPKVPAAPKPDVSSDSAKSGQPRAVNKKDFEQF